MLYFLPFHCLVYQTITNHQKYINLNLYFYYLIINNPDSFSLLVTMDKRNPAFVIFNLIFIWLNLNFFVIYLNFYQTKNHVNFTSFNLFMFITWMYLDFNLYPMIFKSFVRYYLVINIYFLFFIILILIHSDSFHIFLFQIIVLALSV
jgi:hypothetical protein